jgi:hypothetical protein
MTLIVSGFFQSEIHNTRPKPLVTPFPELRYMNSHTRSTTLVDPDLMVTILPELKSVERHSVLILLLFHKIQWLTELWHFLLKRFHHPIQLLKDFWPNDLASSLLNLTSVRRFRPPPPFEHFRGSIPSELSLANSRLPKGSLHALLAEIFK